MKLQGVVFAKYIKQKTKLTNFLHSLGIMKRNISNYFTLKRKLRIHDLNTKLS